MRQLLANASSFGFSFAFTIPLIFFVSSGEQLNAPQFGIYLMFGLTLGLQPSTTVWDKSQLRALGMGEADIRRNYLILMPVVSVIVCCVLVACYVLTRAINWQAPSFWILLATVVAVNLACIISGVVRAGDNSEVVERTTAEATDEANTVGEAGGIAKRFSVVPLGALEGVLRVETRWHQEEKKVNSPSPSPTVLDYFSTWRIDRHMVLIHLVMLVAMTIGMIGWCATGFSPSGAMWLYPGAMTLLVLAASFGETLNVNLCKWLVFSGDRQRWYAQVTRQLLVWLPSIALLMLIGVAEFLLLHFLFPSSSNLEVHLGGEELALAVLSAMIVAILVELIAIASFWVNNRFSGWLKWVMIVLFCFVVSGAVSGLAIFVGADIEAAGNGVGLVGVITVALAVILLLMLAVLSRGIKRFDTANESINENLGLNAKA